METKAISDMPAPNVASIGKRSNSTVGSSSTGAAVYQEPQEELAYELDKENIDPSTGWLARAHRYQARSVKGDTSHVHSMKGARRARVRAPLGDMTVYNRVQASSSTSMRVYQDSPTQPTAARGSLKSKSQKPLLRSRSSAHEQENALQQHSTADKDTAKKPSHQHVVHMRQMQAPADATQAKISVIKQQPRPQKQKQRQKMSIAKLGSLLR